ncbi:sensor protein ZraS [bacterium BMS3Abin08]|nr:sensor protein ZraS [bacterium BMS3Abin08]
MFVQKKYYSILIVASTLLISYLHYSTLPGVYELHNIFAELYYIPILLGALVFGLKGAVLTFIFASVLYLPYIYINWSSAFPFLANKILHALFSGSFAFIAGFLVDRERERRKQSEKQRYLAGLGQVATTIVHDLKNPLITISGFARRIQEGKGDINKAVQMILDSAQKMQMIVHDVLDFAKPIRLTLKVEDMRNTISLACDSCKAKAEEKGVVLSLNLPDVSLNIAVDGLNMERALVNLISNAVDASDKGEIVVVQAMSEGDWLSVVVKDHGEGMDRETLENVFIPFYTGRTSGTGLGMAIAKKIIEEHRGGIHINSQRGIGTEIIIKLPYKQIGG